MNLKTKLFSYLTYKININRLDELTNWAPLSWLKKWFIQKMITLDFPQHIFIETTSLCNLKCKICPRTSGDTLLGQMNFDLFKKIINEAKQYGPRTFCLHLFGEPLLSPTFINEINYIKQADIHNSIVLTTNGTLLTEKIASAMVKAPVDKIAISFMSTNKQNYKNLTGVDKLEEVERNITRLIKIKKEKKATKPKIIVRMILEEYNNQEAQVFKNKWKNQEVIVEVRPAHNYGGNVDVGQIRDNKNKKIKRWPCYHLWLSPAIHWNGDFSICCDDYARKAVLGNLNEQTVNQLWNSKPLLHFRRQQLGGHFNYPTICQDCNVWTMYSDIWFKSQKKYEDKINF